jgi:hypothetical protein
MKLGKLYGGKKDHIARQIKKAWEEGEKTVWGTGLVTCETKDGVMITEELYKDSIEILKRRYEV